MVVDVAAQARAGFERVRYGKGFKPRIRRSLLPDSS
jgi:hypothetical protein